MWRTRSSSVFVSFAVGLIIVAILGGVKSVNGRTAKVIFGCSRSEIVKLQSTWRWVMTETSSADKAALFTAIIDYIAAKNPNVADVLTRGHTHGVERPEPLVLIAHRLFTDVDMYINTYSDYDTYAGHIDHLATTRTLWARKIVSNIDLLFEAIDKVIGGIILSPSEKTIWTSCLSNMASATKAIVSQALLTAKCDVSRTSGDPAFPIEGTITFSQPALDGTTQVHVDLRGFPVGRTAAKHGMHVHERGTLDERCMKAGSHFNPHGLEHGAPQDSNRHVGDLGNLIPDFGGKVSYTMGDSQVSLHGTNSIIGRAIVVHALEDDLGRGNFPDSKTTGHAGGRIACCIVERTYH